MKLYILEAQDSTIIIRKKSNQNSTVKVLDIDNPSHRVLPPEFDEYSSLYKIHSRRAQQYHDSFIILLETYREVQ